MILMVCTLFYLLSLKSHNLQILNQRVDSIFFVGLSSMAK